MWKDADDVMHPQSYSLWAGTLELVFIHRLAYSWTNEDYDTLRNILIHNRPTLIEYSRTLLQMRNGDVYEAQKYLSGLQFLLDDFPEEMSFLNENEGLLEEAKRTIERLPREGEDPSDVDDYDKEVYFEEFCEEEYDQRRVLSWTTKPPHHTWWNNKLNREYEEGKRQVEIAVESIGRTIDDGKIMDFEK